MLAYPGIAPLTVAVSGASPGILVTSGSGDTYGWWPTPLVVNGNDARNAANLMAAVEALTDRANFLGQHMIDWTRGGTWATWTPGVAWGGHLSIDHSSVADSSTGLAAKGGSTGGGGVNGIGGGGNAYGVKGDGSGNKPGGQFTGGLTGAGATCAGGATSGNGLESTATAGNGVGALLAGHGSGAGAVCVPGGTANTPSVVCSGGPLSLQSYSPASTLALPANVVSSAHISKCWGKITSAGTGTPGLVVVDGVNITSVAASGSSVVVTFATAMSTSDYVVTGNWKSGAPGAYTATSPVFEAALVPASGTAALVAVPGGGGTGTAIDMGGTAGILEFCLMARQ